MKTLILLAGLVSLCGCSGVRLGYPRPNLEIVRSAQSRHQLEQKIGDPTLKYQDGVRELYIYINDVSLASSSNERALIYALIIDGVVQKSGERSTADNADINAVKRQFNFTETHLVSAKS